VAGCRFCGMAGVDQCGTAAHFSCTRAVRAGPAERASAMWE
jgi:hypothetical protein